MGAVIIFIALFAVIIYALVRMAVVIGAITAKEAKDAKERGHDGSATLFKVLGGALVIGILALIVCMFL